MIIFRKDSECWQMNVTKFLSIAVSSNPNFDTRSARHKTIDIITDKAFDYMLERGFKRVTKVNKDKVNIRVFPDMRIPEHKQIFMLEGGK